MKRTNLGLCAMLICGFAGISAPVTAQAAGPLSLGAGDVVVEAGDDGYHLFIRQKEGASSVLLSEAFELPNHKLSTYAFRPVGPNPANDNEKRLLDGKFLTQPSLVSSTPLEHAPLGRVFQIVIPHAVEYGYPNFPNARYGKIEVQKALVTPNTPFWFSVRVFAKPFADYSGAYQDNAFDLKSFVIQTYHPTPDHFETGLVEGFSRLGNAYKAKDVDDALNQVRKILDRDTESLDVVACIDTTMSMGPAIQEFKTQLVGAFRDGLKRAKTYRIGLVFYRDYMEEYVTRVLPFTSNPDQVQHDLDEVSAKGGGDIPEAVVEGMWAGLSNFNWLAKDRVVIVLGDAPQHPTPRGNVTEDMMKQLAAEKRVERQLIMLPQTEF